MGIISVCLDCPHYQTGGWCRIKQKTVSALAPACEDSQKTNEDQEDDGLKTCRKCGRVLPKESFAKNAGAPDGLQSTCRECAAAAFKAWQDKQKEKKNDESLWQLHDRLLSDNPDHMRKVCSKCGQNLPLDEFYIKNGKPHYMCKSCVKKYNVEHARKIKATKAEAAQKAGVKTCKTCGRELPLDAFGGHAKTPDGKATVCLECMREKIRKNHQKAYGSKTVPDPIPAPMLDEGIKVHKAAPQLPPLADIDTAGSLENYDSRQLVAELRARGYHVTCEREIKTIESL